ncbi:DUF2877 domain-containing protein [Jatrophihabitans sp. DSM 45814]
MGQTFLEARAETVQAGVLSVFAEASEFLRSQVRNNQGTAHVLGVFAEACYVELTSGAVCAILTTTAVVQPIGILLGGAVVHDLRDWVGAAREASVGVDSLKVGRIEAHIRALRDPSLRYLGEPDPALLARLECTLRLEASRIALPAWPSEAAALQYRLPSREGTKTLARSIADCIGHGPGLTPSGDDFLCGLLAGGVLFGREVAAHRAVIRHYLRTHPGATTSLSRALLLRACAGEGLTELSELGKALCRHADRSTAEAVEQVETAARTVTSIGHSSGLALATGLLYSAEMLSGGVRRPSNSRADVARAR